MKSTEAGDVKADRRQAALDYHEFPTHGKISVAPTKQLVTQSDLALAYSPGVAAACEAIVADPSSAFRYTARGNLVGVVSNGTAVLGLGAIGPLAAKPVMEGKAVLFKKFAGIDVFDIEVDQSDPYKLIEVVAALEPTFGAINLEDIKAPECFIVERELRKRMKIPVFHDDQHGTAITVGAAVLNGLTVCNKKMGEVKLVVSGAGAAALACVDLLLDLGLKHENIWLTDLAGVVYEGRRELMDPEKARFTQKTEARTLDEVIRDADVFLGLSAGGVLSPAMVQKMAPRPLILALANPTPEILPEQALAARPDAVLATGRSDYPNQVNNVLCFPFIFRGALDVGATTITRAMEIAAVHALAALARQEQSDVVAAAYGGLEDLSFGPGYLIPKPFDPRLIVKIAPAVAQAAMESGVATRPIADLDAYGRRLEQFVYHSGTLMAPIFAAARKIPPASQPHRIRRGRGRARAAGGADRGRRAAGDAHPRRAPGGHRASHRAPRPTAARRRACHGGQSGTRCALPRVLAGVSPPHAAQRSHRAIREARNAPPDHAHRRHAVAQGEADGLICGMISTTARHLKYIDRVIGRRPGVHIYGAMSGLILPGRQLFLVDTHVNLDPSAEQLAEITQLAAEQLRSFGLAPKVALLSHSNFGSSDAPSALKMRAVLALLERLHAGAGSGRGDAWRLRAR